MPVYRQDGNFVIAGPSYDGCNESIDNGAMECLRISYQACAAMSLITGDIYDLLNAEDPAIDKAHPMWEDLKRLVRLLAYYVYHPMEACLTRPRDSPDIFSSYAPGGNQDFAAALQAVIDGLEFADATLQHVLEIPSIVDAVSAADKTVDVPDIPAYGTVELLLRVMADKYHGNFRTIVHLNEGFKKSKLQAKAGDKRPSAVPQIAFACMGRPGTGDFWPTFVITTSKDRWYGFGTMRRWVSEARLVRTTQAPFVAGDIETITQQSAELNQKNVTQTLPVKSKALEAERLKWITEQTVGVFNHGEEWAMPMKCPGFEPNSRCIRCQALFHWNVEYSPELVKLEQDSWSGGEKVNEGMDCAEAFAHFYCVGSGHGVATD